MKKHISGLIVLSVFISGCGKGEGAILQPSATELLEIESFPIQIVTDTAEATYPCFSKENLEDELPTELNSGGWSNIRKWSAWIG